MAQREMLNSLPIRFFVSKVFACSLNDIDCGRLEKINGWETTDRY